MTYATCKIHGLVVLRIKTAVASLYITLSGHRICT